MTLAAPPSRFTRGGVFTTRHFLAEAENGQLHNLNRNLMQDPLVSLRFNSRDSASPRPGQINFLEYAARVGGGVHC